MEGDKTQRQLQTSHEWNVTILCKDLHLHDCQHSKSHINQRFKPVHYPEVFRNCRNEYICACVRDGTSGVICWWTGGHKDQEITQPTTLSIHVVSS